MTKTARRCYFISLAMLMLLFIGIGSGNAAFAQGGNASISGIVQD